MATRFLQQAQQQLNPLFAKQTKAAKAQLPAINQLYDVLVQGLEGQRQTETQNILESASSRGVLRSSLPVDLQTQLGQALLAERGKLEAGRAGDIADVQSDLSQIGLQRAQSVTGLADALQQQSLREREFKMQLALARESGGAGGGATEYDLTGDIGDYAKQLLAGVIDPSSVPQEIRGRVIAAANQLAKRSQSKKRVKTKRNKYRALKEQAIQQSQQAQNRTRFIENITPGLTTVRQGLIGGIRSLFQ